MKFEHPSLKEEYAGPPPLKPQRVMRVNEPCWCGSKKKWKKCHRDREKQMPEPIGKLLDLQRSEKLKGHCLHPDANERTCSQKIIRAHTIQRSGVLAAIAENGHVISAKKGYDNIIKNEGKIIPQAIGVKDASTFMGFCSFHDNKMFEPIEKNPLHLNTESAFLLSFKAISYEYFIKEAALRIIKIQKESDKGRSFEEQSHIQQYLHLVGKGLERGMKNLEDWKSKYDSAYIENNFSNFESYSARLSGLLPIVACGAFNPEYDFNGNRLQILSRGTAPFELVCFNIASVGRLSVLALGWSGEKGGPSESFVNSFQSLDNQKKANTAFYLAIEHLENIYFQPSWWKHQPQNIKEELINRIRSDVGLSGTIRTSKSFTSFPYILSNLNIEDELRT